jgi:hypothetical protein
VKAATPPRRLAVGQLICQPMCRGLKLGLKPKRLPALPRHLCTAVPSLDAADGRSLLGSLSAAAKCFGRGQRATGALLQQN